ncbi:MAG: alpha-E domain-containing protein [Rhizobacter sp.]|nr:alpha-E domain-containing protein [Rhizobacter sp.]
MLSRTADHLFWMARYTERAGQVAQRLAAQPQHRRARQRVTGFSAPQELNHAV